jgi:ATP-dependent Lhr-like helicase
LEVNGLILRGHFTSTQVEQADSQIEWCERRLLARIHRLTLGRLRKEIEPVTAAQLSRWLLKWQHLSTGTQLKGELGLLEIIKQLQGFEAPANAWEREIFAKRMKDYDRSLLDQLCLTGRVGWGRLSPHPAIQLDNNLPLDNNLLKKTKKERVNPTSIAPITFFVREESDWLPPHLFLNSQENELTGLSSLAQKIYTFLQQKGASFQGDIIRGVGHLKTEVEAALWELVAAGLVTADSFDNLRALIDPRRRLDSRRRHRAAAFYSGGRWSLLNPGIEMVVDPVIQLEAKCWLLLKRYGVVFRDLLAREKNIPRWRELLLAFRRLEDKGEIRGGRFVSGFLGEQFALPYAVDSLRAIKKQEPQGEIIKLAAADPLNLIGILLPGARISATSNKKIVLQDGVLQDGVL